MLSSPCVAFILPGFSPFLCADLLHSVSSNGTFSLSPPWPVDWPCPVPSRSAGCPSVLILQQPEDSLEKVIKDTESLFKTREKEYQETIDQIEVRVWAAGALPEAQGGTVGGQPASCLLDPRTRASICRRDEWPSVVVAVVGPGDLRIWRQMAVGSNPGSVTVWSEPSLPFYHVGGSYHIRTLGLVAHAFTH